MSEEADWEKEEAAPAAAAATSTLAAPALKATSTEWTPSWMGAPAAPAAATAAAAPAEPAAAPAAATPAAAAATPAVPVPAQFAGRDLDSLTAAEMDSLSEDQLNAMIAAAEAAEAAAPPPAAPVVEAAPAPAAAAKPAKKAAPAAKKKKKEPREKKEVVVKQPPMPEDDSDPRPHLNAVFIGHVDAGKSTICGSILYHTGQVDERTISKFQKEAKAANRESWFLAFILDTNEEERAKGKTVEVGRARFGTENKRFTVLDAPGHRNYVPNMISGASQADVGVLVISARRGEFEAGFEKGGIAGSGADGAKKVMGQTREHALLAKTLGVSKLVVCVNKMDEETVQWSEERYNEIVEQLKPYLRKSCGYKIRREVLWLPMSGITGEGLHKRVPTSVCPWYDGPSLFEVLDGIEPTGRDPVAPLRVPLIDKWSDRGCICMGKVEAGTIFVGMKVILMPLSQPSVVLSLEVDGEERNVAKVGENVNVKLKNIDPDHVKRGFVICDASNPCAVVDKFVANVQLLELLEHRPIMTAGYNGVLHIHTAAEECAVGKIISTIDAKTGKPRKERFMKSFKSGSVMIKLEQSICLEKFDNIPQMGRFTLRDEERTIAIGMVTGLPKSAVGGSSGRGGRASK